MLTFKQLIEDTEFNQVWEYIASYYKERSEISIESFKEQYKNLYKKLTVLLPTDNTKNMYIYINVFKDDGNDDYYCPENFYENDTEAYFDVCGKDDEWCGYSIAAASYEDWLSFYIEDKTLTKLSYTSIVAHCLWEMTFYGFEKVYDEKGYLVYD